MGFQIRINYFSFRNMTSSQTRAEYCVYNFVNVSANEDTFLGLSYTGNDEIHSSNLKFFCALTSFIILLVYLR
jgi:hypothetical protein